MSHRRFSYKVHEIQPNAWGVLKLESLQAELDKLGAQGWELVELTMPGGMGRLSAVAVLKKEL